MVEPETRPSLMLRLRQAADQQAWTEFVSIYEPLLLRLMKQRGLQEARCAGCDSTVDSRGDAGGRTLAAGWAGGVVSEMAVRDRSPAGAQVRATRPQRDRDRSSRNGRDRHAEVARQPTRTGAPDDVDVR